MRVLVVGGGGREHAIVWKLAQSPLAEVIFCAPGNAGIAGLARCEPVSVMDFDGIVSLARRERIDFTVVAPDDPLAGGLVDRLEAEGFAAFGPTAAAAKLESSKLFAKRLMEKYGIPTARFRAFDDIGEAEGYIRRETAPLVIKADGLALGKGVVVAQTTQEALSAARDMLVGRRFKDAGSTIVVEECMTGPEVTVLAFADGQTIVPMLPSRDYKRAGDGNQGPNTGGMGAICPAPGYTAAIARQCEETIFRPTLDAMRREGCPFRGVLYFGLMLTPDGPKVVEYNARFGDPETQAVLPLLESDLLPILMACREGTLAQAPIQWRPDAACCVVLASGGYPGAIQTGFPIEGLDAAPNALVFHAGTTRDAQGRIVSNGGRVLGVTASAGQLPEAVSLAYQAMGHIQFEGSFCRNDIGREG